MRKTLRIDGKIVGHFDDKSKTYTKNVEERKHKMWKYRGYGIQNSIVIRLQKLGCKKVIIKELDTKKTFEAKFSQYLETSKVYDFGHGEQAFVPTSEMKELP